MVGYGARQPLRYMDKFSQRAPNPPYVGRTFQAKMRIAEGFWWLLRSWLQPHRGLSQEKQPWYLGFFQFVHHVRIRGKGLLSPLLTLLVA